MKIHFVDGTLRFENNEGSWAWPVYMNAPVQDAFIDAVLPTLKDFEAQFDSNTCTLTVDGETLTPDSDVSGYSQEVQTFHATVYGFGHYAEIARLKEKEARGTVYKTETVMEPQEKIEVVDGKAVLSMIEVPVERPVPPREIPIFDESGNPIMLDPEPVVDTKTGKIKRDPLGGTLFHPSKQKMHKVPVVDEVESFTEAERVRLETLTAKEAESVRTR